MERTGIEVRPFLFALVFRSGYDGPCGFTAQYFALLRCYCL